MINCGNKDTKYKGPTFTISAQLASQIKHQIEYYFSNVNIITDQFLRQIIEANKGWVKIKDLLSFNRLKHIINHQLPDATQHQIQRIIVIALKDSLKVKVGRGQVKLRKSFNIYRSAKKMIYFEGQGLNKQILLNLLSSYYIAPQNLYIRTGTSWFIVDFQILQKQQVAALYQKLKPETSNQLKIFTMEQFLQYQQKFKQLFSLDDKKIVKTNICIPPRQLLLIDEIQVRQIVAIQKKQPPKKQIDYNKIFSKFLPSRNKKTPQSYQKFRAEKIALKKKLKQMKISENKMQIET